MSQQKISLNDRFDLGRVAHLHQALILHDPVWIFATPGHFVKNGFGDLTADDAIVDEFQKTGQIRW